MPDADRPAGGPAPDLATLGRQLLDGSRPAVSVVADLGRSQRADAIAHLAGLLRDPTMAGAAAGAVTAIVAECPAADLVGAEAAWRRRTRWQDPNRLRAGTLGRLTARLDHPVGVLAVAAMTEDPGVRRAAAHLLVRHVAASPVAGLRLALLQAAGHPRGAGRASLVAAARAAALVDGGQARAAAPLARRLDRRDRDRLRPLVERSGGARQAGALLPD